MREIFRHSLAMLRNKRLLALHLVLSAVLLTGASLWLLIPEERGWQLLASAVSAIVLITIFLWLHSGTLAYGAGPQPENFRAAMRPSARKLLWLLAGVVILFWCMRVVDGWTESQAQAAVYLYSKAPTWIRPTNGESTYFRVVGWAIAIVFWYLLPCLMLPWMAAKVAGGKFVAGLRTLLRWRYWLAMAMTVLVGVGVTELLLGWVPGHSLRAQSVSLGIRLALAYLLATLAWLAIAGILGYFVGPQRTATAVAASAE